jgi:hypothetical protein
VCPTIPCQFPNSSYITESRVQLFDVYADPNERNDLSQQQPAVRRQLLERLQFYVNKSIPQDHGTKDNRSDPANFGGVWTPWEGDPDPAHCAHPPVPPHPPCGGDGEIGDGSLLLLPEHPGMCTASGWCSGKGYSGPARQVVVSIDGKVVASGVANASRAVAGPHGLDLTFDCSIFAHGNHTATVGCKCYNTAEIQVLRGGSICTTGAPARLVPCPNTPPDLLKL